MTLSNIQKTSVKRSLVKVATKVFHIDFGVLHEKALFWQANGTLK